MLKTVTSNVKTQIVLMPLSDSGETKPIYWTLDRSMIRDVWEHICIKIILHCRMLRRQVR
jgi:hypothetical protein